MTDTPHSRQNTFNIRPEYLICLLLMMGILAVYGQTRNYEFVSFDDSVYVTENQHIRNGLNLKNLSWAFMFSRKEGTYWHPLTWLSHMADCELYGLDAGMHHMTNVMFHMANTMLLFLLFMRMTGAVWRSAFLAALFALHPVNVESVAWVAERKNVLSTFFWMLTMYAYAYYAEHPGLFRYLLTLLIFVAGLLSKPMLVTLPCVLLLMDCYPLGRFRFGTDGNAHERKTSVFRLIAEKIPFLMLSGAAVWLATLSLRGYGQMKPAEDAAMNLRMANALVSYLKYMGKLFLPQNLAIYYPFPDAVLVWQAVASAIILLLLTIPVILMLRRLPFLAVGWFWFLGSLVPVSGLVQAGVWPAMADRWAYVPFIGLFIIIAWGIPEFAAYRNIPKSLTAATAAICLSGLAVITWFQVRHWENSITLYGHAIAVTTDNSLMYNNMGVALNRQGRPVRAVGYYTEALRIKPDDARTHNNMGTAFIVQGKIDRAIQHYREAIRIKPDYLPAQNNLRRSLSIQKKIDKAVSEMQEAIRLISTKDTLDEKNRKLDTVIAQYKFLVATLPGFRDEIFDINNYAKVCHVREAYEKFLSSDSSDAGS